MAELSNTRDVREAWIEWLDHCFGGRFIDVMFFGKTIGGVPEPWVEAIQALEMVLRHHGWIPRQQWAYNFRGISGKPCSCGNYGNCSLHASGAIDIDQSVNPQSNGPQFITGSFPPELIADVEAIRNEQGEQMFTWGGRWGMPDRMHFQPRVAPNRCKVNWSTVAGYQSEEIDSMYTLERAWALAPDGDGSRSSDIAYHAGKVRRALGLGTDVCPSDGRWPQSMVDVIADEFGGSGTYITGNMALQIEDRVASAQSNGSPTPTLTLDEWYEYRREVAAEIDALADSVRP